MTLRKITADNSVKFISESERERKPNTINKNANPGKQI